MPRTTPRQAAARLNDHHIRTCAGFYGLGQRFFAARVRKGVLQVTPDFGTTWQDVADYAEAFHDHNGRRIFL